MRMGSVLPLAFPNLDNLEASKGRRCKEVLLFAHDSSWNRIKIGRRWRIIPLQESQVTVNNDTQSISLSHNKPQITTPLLSRNGSFANSLSFEVGCV